MAPLTMPEVGGEGDSATLCEGVTDDEYGEPSAGSKGEETSPLTDHDRQSPVEKGSRPPPEISRRNAYPRPRYHARRCPDTLMELPAKWQPDHRAAIDRREQSQTIDA